jgi:hypothetical protein
MNSDRRSAIVYEFSFTIGAIVLAAFGLVFFMSRRLSLEIRFLVIAAAAVLSIPAYVFLHVIYVLSQFDGHYM